jgi:polyferredoxin
MSKKKNKRTNYYRFTLQGIIVALLGYMVVRLIVDKSYHPDFEAYCPFGGMQSLGSYLNTNSLACAMSTTQIVMGIALAVGVLLISKLFCSYICPIGTFTEWLGRIADRYKLRFDIKGIADKMLRSLKYALLFITFYFTVTSSELFCKQFDPYYAIFSGFDGDVTMAYAIPAILITIFGSFFIRQFWCKYLCPLGAAANIFAFAPVFVVLTLLYWAMVSLIGWQIHWAWYLGAVSLAGLLLEVWRRSGMYFPLMKITRDQDICTNCKICDKVCPYAIKVSEADAVKHIDCHMCVDCVVKCPEKGALTINRKPLRWLPAASVVILVAAGLFISAQWELPTIDMRWGSEEQFENAKVYHQAGLKSVKCFGSARAFAGQMQSVEGVLGVQSFVKGFRVKVFYDPEIVDERGIREGIFNPVNWVLVEPPAGLEQLSVVDMGIDRFFDTRDAFLLGEMLKQNPGIFGIETYFGEPVHAKIYYDPGLADPVLLKSIIEHGSVTYTDRDQTFTERTPFKVEYIEPDIAVIDTREYLQKTFRPFNRTFNDYDTYSEEELSVYQLPFHEAIRQDKQRWFVFLMSHLSGHDGVVGMSVQWQDDAPVLRVYYVTGMIDKTGIQAMLLMPNLTVHYADGSTRDFENPFTFPAFGEELQQEEI